MKHFEIEEINKFIYYMRACACVRVRAHACMCVYKLLCYDAVMEMLIHCSTIYMPEAGCLVMMDINTTNRMRFTSEGDMHVCGFYQISPSALIVLLEGLGSSFHIECG